MPLLPSPSPLPLQAQHEARGEEIGEGRRKDSKAVLGYWVPGGGGKNHKEFKQPHVVPPPSSFEKDKRLLKKLFKE